MAGIYAKPELIEHQVLTQRWREEHVRRGDLALIEAGRLAVSGYTNQVFAHTWAAIAQAHYAAANVRARAIADVAPASSTIPADPVSWPL